jgi:hypothetical protein
MKADSVLDAKDHCLYQSIIGSCVYLVTWTRPDLAYPISYLIQLLTASSKSDLTVAKLRLPYTKGTKDLQLSLSHSDALEITLEEYSNSDYRHCMDIQ